MLVAISILLILAVLTLSAINFTQSYDRVRSAARQVQSYYEGAKSRAAYAKDARGVRFLLDETDPTTASSMLFIGPPEKFSQDTIRVRWEAEGNAFGDTTLDPAEDLNLNGNDDPVLITYPAIWNNLTSRNRLVDGARLELPQGSGVYYTIARSVNPSAAGQWYLTRDYPLPALHNGGIANLEYELQLEPTVLPNQEPRPLGTGIVIDLDNSKIPGSWGTAGNYSSRLDVLFTPRGAVTGSAASEGTIHLVLASTADTVNGVPPAAPVRQNSTAYTAGQWVRPTLDNQCFYLCTSGGTSGGGEPAWPTATGQTVSDGAVTWECYQATEKLLVSLFTHTGRVSSHRIDPDDPYREAELGREVR